MKKLLFPFLMLIASISFSQSTSANLEENPTTYQDSLKLATKMIYELDYSNLIKQKERFTYLSREKSNKIYPAVLIIITDRIKNYNNEK